MKAVAVPLCRGRILTPRRRLRGGLQDARGRRRPCLEHRDGARLLWVGLNESSHAVVTSDECEMGKAKSFRRVTPINKAFGFESRMLFGRGREKERESA